MGSRTNRTSQYQDQDEQRAVGVIIAAGLVIVSLFYLVWHIFAPVTPAIDSISVSDLRGAARYQAQAELLR